MLASEVGRKFSSKTKIKCNRVSKRRLVIFIAQFPQSHDAKTHTIPTKPIISFIRKARAN